MKATKLKSLLATTLLALLFLILGWLFFQAFKVTAIPSKPNIIILYADDLGYGDLVCYNPKSPIPTPNLDALASQGMRFTDAHSSSGICTPSRYALLTGRHHWRDFHNIVNSFEPSVFPKGRLTMAGMLQAEGYRTAAMGKWHLGWDWDAIKKSDLQASGEKRKKKKMAGLEDYDWSKPIPGGPLSVGFDHYFGEDVINFPPYCWFEDDKIVQAPDRMLEKWIWEPVTDGRTEVRPGPMAPDWNPYEVLPKITQHAVEFIKSRKDAKQPFFLYFAYPSPHAPIIPNKEFIGKSGLGPYGDHVVETDHSVGQILGALKEAGLDDNTLVIFSSDNGAEHYAYERDEKYGHWSSHPLRGLKRDIYEGGHRLPFLVKWPGVVPPDSVCGALVSQIDLMATLAAVVGTKLPDNAAEDSHNLLPLFQGGTTPVRESHVHNTTATYAIRHGDWVLVDAKSGYISKIDPNWETRHGYPAEDSQPAELYNLKEDIAQKKNLAAAHPEKLEELRSLLKKIQEQGHSAPRLEGVPSIPN
jgi:arylsulfatase A